MRQTVSRACARWGPQVRCQRCGQTLFRGLALVSRGQVKLFGADEVLVSVDFETTTRLGLRHADLSECRRGRARPSSRRGSAEGSEQ